MESPNLKVEAGLTAAQRTTSTESRLSDQVERAKQEKIHRAKVRLAKQTIEDICDPHDSDFDSDDDGLGPVRKPLPSQHFYRRRIANEICDAIEQMVETGKIDPTTICHDVRRVLKKCMQKFDEEERNEGTSSAGDKGDKSRHKFKLDADERLEAKLLKQEVAEAAASEAEAALVAEVAAAAVGGVDGNSANGNEPGSGNSASGSSASPGSPPLYYPISTPGGASAAGSLISVNGRRRRNRGLAALYQETSTFEVPASVISSSDTRSSGPQSRGSVDFRLSGAYLSSGGPVTPAPGLAGADANGPVGYPSDSKAVFNLSNVSRLTSLFNRSLQSLPGDEQSPLEKQQQQQQTALQLQNGTPGEQKASLTAVARPVTLNPEQKDLHERRSRRRASIAYERVKHVLNNEKLHHRTSSGIETSGSAESGGLGGAGILESEDTAKFLKEIQKAKDKRSSIVGSITIDPFINPQVEPMPPALKDLSQKPDMTGNMGLLCVAHLPKKYTAVALAIRDTIYDPDHYDDGTYAPQYIRLCLHASSTYDAKDGSGGLEGACMRFQPEKTDAHNKGLYHTVQRLDRLIKSHHTWISHSDLWCLAAYVCIECAGGPVMEVRPGRRDTSGRSEWLLMNYRERGDLDGGEDEPVCPHLKKHGCMPGRLPMGEEGHLGGAFTAGKPEEQEMTALAHNIRRIFGRMITGEFGGCPDELIVALISGGHAFGRCHPGVSGYAGPWTSNPGKFSNAYCQRLADEEWALVDRTMKDHSGDFLTGLKPKGMRRQYVNKNGKGDLMMLPSDMALLRDEGFAKWIHVYAADYELMKRNFAMAFKQLTEQGFQVLEVMGANALAVPDLLPFRTWKKFFAVRNANRSAPAGPVKLFQAICNPMKWLDPAAGGCFAGVAYRLKRVKRDLADATATDLLRGGVEVCGNEERRNRLAIEKAERMKEERERDAKEQVVASIAKVGNPYSAAEVAKHSTKADCWVIINGQICNLSKFMAMHPGGEGPIMRFAGKDASTEWNAIHRPDAIEKLAKDTIIGYLEG